MSFLVTHLSPSKNSSQQERFDTLISPCGTVATLGEIIKQHAPDRERYLYDGGFPGNREVRDAMKERVEDCLIRGLRPDILFSLLLYNSGPTLQAIEELRQAFGDRIRVTVGGQLVPYVSGALVKNPHVDHVAIGDGEVLVPALLKDSPSKILEGKSHDQHFAGIDYAGFFALEERLREQKKQSGFTQLTAQGPGGPGCSWAANNPNGACSFCALQNITTMNLTPLETSLGVEKSLQDTFGVERIFDVANQFLPFLRKEDILAWLKSYHTIRQRIGLTVKKYAYVTVQSIMDEQIVAELARAGITEVYIGIDHFDAASLKQQNKSHRGNNLEKVLNNLKNHGITFRCGLVLGSSAETEEGLQKISQGVDMLLGYDNLRAIGIFPLEVLPGSKIYTEMKQKGMGLRIITDLETRGFLDREGQKQLSRIWMNRTSPLGYEKVIEFKKELERKIASSGRFSYAVDKASKSS